MKVRTQGQVVKMVVILVEEEKMREMLVVVVGVVDRSPSPTLLTPLPGPPQGRALKNYRYFHFIGVVRRHYRAFTRRSGNDV